MSQPPDMDGYAEFEDDEQGAALPGFVRDPIGVLHRRWKIMVAAAFLGIVATVVASMLVKPTYTARASVLVSSQRISEQFVQSTVESNQIEKISAIVGEILSRQELAKLVHEFDLYNGRDGSSAISMEDRVARLRQNVSIAPDSSQGPQRRDQTAIVYLIEFSSPSPKKSAGVTNSLASSFTDTHLEMRSRQARLTTDFLRAELDEAANDLAQQERAITEFKQRYRGELPGELQTNLARLDRLQQQRQSLALQIAEAETRIATLSGSVVDVDSESPAGRLADLRAEYERFSTLYTAEHPNVVSLKRQIAALEAQLGISPGGSVVPAPQGVAAAARLTLEELLRQRAQTVAEFEALDARVARIPERQEELVALEQRAEILRENHQEFLRKVSQAELAEAVESAQQGERATVLDSAVPPSKPDRSPLMLIALGLVASIGFAGGVGLLWEIVDSVIVAPDEIEHEFRVPILGSVARIR